jgi:hypothetical protein
VLRAQEVVHARQTEAFRRVREAVGG